MSYKNHKNEILLKKHGVFNNKLPVQILILIHKYTYNNHDIIPIL